ncbi:hypothetical protein BN903_12 [Halorubrum sp. AJ67]|nr:hypothetical protein BN903_12 [Halorubrum sp. AJ67]
MESAYLNTTRVTVPLNRVRGVIYDRGMMGTDTEHVTVE